MEEQSNNPRLKSKLQEFFGFLKQIDRKTLLWFLAFFIFTGIYIFIHEPPKDFPVGQVFTIETGDSLQSITNKLYDAHIIKSELVFRTHVIILGGEKKLKAGDYLLDKKEGPADLADRFVNGKYHLVTTKITIPEGWSVSQIADYLSNTLINFDRATFLAIAKPKEGYLFPDTYFVSPAIKPQKLLDLMQKNFDVKIHTLFETSTTTHSLKDIVTMASILEEEARTTESRRTVAGILWKRITLKMPLQVDSTLTYITGKSTYDLTVDDLEIDSPYNTYKYAGLPPAPIGNPGLDALYSAVNPISTKYLYYLSSKSGNMYYATTFEQHKKNIELYLNK